MEKWLKGFPYGDQEDTPPLGEHVALEVPGEGPAADPMERKKISSVLFIRSAIMAMLAIFLAAVALTSFFLAKQSLTSQVDRLGDMVRAGLIGQTVDRLNVQLDEGSHCVDTLQKALVLVWGSQRNATRASVKEGADVSAFTVYGSCAAISGIGWVLKDGTYSVYQATPNATQGLSTTSAVVSYSYVVDPIPDSGDFVSYRQPLNASNGANLSAPVPVYPGTDQRKRAWYSQALTSADGSAYTVSVNSNGQPALVQSRRVNALNGTYLGQVVVIQYLNDLSNYLSQIDLGGGYLYVTNNSVILADSYGIPAVAASGNSSSTSLLANQSSVPAVRNAALFLQEKLGTLSNFSASFRDVKLGGGRYSINVCPFFYKTLPLQTVVVLPRSLIMGSIDKKTRIAIIVIVAVTVGICLMGFGLICLFTGRVSREFQLRFELVQQLNARRQAEARSETKSRFLANMSHELRTPMAGIIGLLDILLADELTVEQELNLSQIKQCATSLLGLLNDVLDLGKIEAGKMTLAAEEFDLGAELESLVDLFSVQCSGKGIEIGLDLPETVERTLKGDSARVRQIFSNLITNSIKFTKKGYLIVRCWQDPVEPPSPPKSASFSRESVTPSNSGSIVGSPRADASKRRVRLFFEVEDTGTGIPVDKREAVFESFVQADQTSTRLYGGSGLGLGITRSLVQMMGGKIEILDKEGPGTLIRFDLTFEAPRNTNSARSSASFGLSPERLPLGDELRQLATAGEVQVTAGEGEEEDVDRVGRTKRSLSIFAGLGKTKTSRRSRSPGDKSWLVADESGLSVNPPSPRGRAREKSLDLEQGQNAEVPLSRPQEGSGAQERQLAPIVSGLELYKKSQAPSTKRMVLLGMPGLMGRGLAKTWLEKEQYAVQECENWTSTFRCMENLLRERPAFWQGAALEGEQSMQQPEELLVVFDIDLLKSSEESPAVQAPSEKLASLKNLLYKNQKARLDWAARKAESQEPTRVAVGWLIETTTPSAMRHFLFKSGFPIKVAKPLYPTRLQKLMNLLNEAAKEPPSMDVMPPSDFPTSLPPLELQSGANPFSGRTLSPELQADLAKHQLSGGLSWTFFDNRGARAPIPSSLTEIEPQSWSTSPSGTTSSSGAKDFSRPTSPLGGSDPGTFCPPERTISLSIDIPEFSPPASPLKRDDTSPDSNFAFHSEGLPSPLISDMLLPEPLVKSLNPSSSFGSSALSYDTLLRSQSSGLSSQSSVEELSRNLRRGAQSPRRANMDLEFPSPIIEQEVLALTQEVLALSRSASPSPEISPTTPIISSAFTALRQSTLASSLSPPKGSESNSPASSVGRGSFPGSPAAGVPMGSPVDSDANAAEDSTTQKPAPVPRSSPEQGASKPVTRRSPPTAPLPSKALAGLYILVAEDTPVLQRLAVTLLTKLGAEVVAVDNGRQAVDEVTRRSPGGAQPLAEPQTGVKRGRRSFEYKRAEEGPQKPVESSKAAPPLSPLSLEAEKESELPRAFDCLLMDCQMPQMDGYDATKAIRQLEVRSGSHLPILALTAHAMIEDEQKCLSAGMDGYLTKPINTKLLVSTIKKLTGSKS